MNDEESTPKRRRGPRKVTAKYLENSAAHYLGRFSSSKANLRRIMMQKVMRSAAHHGTDVAEGEKWLDDVIAKFERLGFLDDQAFADMRARGLHARGTPLKGIRFKLKQQGVGDDEIGRALETLVDEIETSNLDLAAAVKLARRRRLGPFRTDDPDERSKRREKDLAALARAGFSYDVAQQVIEAASVEELEESLF